jgi:pimeloyl-ACP methyl ester carboxylesterase
MQMAKSGGFGPFFKLAALIAMAGSSWSQGCRPVREPKTPMDTILYRGDAGAPGRLIVLLPGYGSAAEDFASHGFIDAVHRLDPSVSAIASDAHFGYYRSESLIERLTEDVIEPAVASGFTEIWLAGTSMGGMGALAYAHRNEGRIAGIILMSPYLGDRELISGIIGAGGPAQWSPPDREDIFQDIWLWLVAHGGEEIKPPIFLAYGEKDRLAVSNRLLADLLPPERVLVRNAGHGWRLWDEIWPEMVRMSLGIEPSAP